MEKWTPEGTKEIIDRYTHLFCFPLSGSCNSRIENITAIHDNQISTKPYRQCPIFCHLIVHLSIEVSHVVGNVTLPELVQLCLPPHAALVQRLVHHVLKRQRPTLLEPISIDPHDLAEIAQKIAHDISERVQSS